LLTKNAGPDGPAFFSYHEPLGFFGGGKGGMGPLIPVSDVGVRHQKSNKGGKGDQLAGIAAMAALNPLAGFRLVAGMDIPLNNRLFVLAGLLLPVFSAHANLNRGDSPLREIPFGKLADVRAMAQPVGDPFRGWSSVHLPTMGHLMTDAVGEEPGELNAEEDGPGDEPYFGSATWSEVSGPKMVDFSFGQPCGPLTWWKSSEVEPSAIAPASLVAVSPKMTFEWGNLRSPANPSRGASTNAGMALFPLSLLGMLGLVFRRGN
jgi:hypothetical protein